MVTAQFSKPIKSLEIGNVGKLVLSESTLKIINDLHRLVGPTEWSGALFIKLVEGDLKQLNNLVFKSDFIYPMDIGSHSFTSIDYNAEILKADDIRDDLLEYNIHLVHSHHTMQTFFSGTDKDELLKNSSLYNYYISLIVNFDGKYTAKIAFPSKTESKSNFTLLDENAKPFVISKEESEDIVLLGDLEIVKDVEIVESSWIDLRVAELKQKKIKILPTTKYNFNNFNNHLRMPFDDDDDFPDYAISNKQTTKKYTDYSQDWYNYLLFSPTANIETFRKLDFKNCNISKNFLDGIDSAIEKLTEEKFEDYILDLELIRMDDVYSTVFPLYETDLIKFKDVITKACVFVSGHLTERTQKIVNTLMEYVDNGIESQV